VKRPMKVVQDLVVGRNLAAATRFLTVRRRNTGTNRIDLIVREEIAVLTILRWFVQNG
jgi:hypothetical protein